jgi:hypothetical protein
VPGTRRAETSDRLVGAPLGWLVWTGGRQARGLHVVTHVATCAESTLDLLAGGVLIEGQHAELRFNVDLERALMLRHW